MKKLLLATLLALSPAAAAAQAAPGGALATAPAAEAPALADADPAMWVVRDEDTTIYLFGTFHLLDGRPWFNDEVKTAFDASDELVLEAILPENPAAMQPLVQRYAVDPSGRRLSERLSPEQNAALGRALASIGAPAAAFEPLEPWFVSMTLTAVIGQKLGINGENGPETVLSRAARARSLPVGELEGLEWQIQLFDNMPEAQQLAQLRQTLDSLETADQVLAPMLAAWSTGDVDGLQRIMDEQAGLDRALRETLFTARNRAWASWIRERMARSGTVFLAVGAGHLAGGDSVQAALRDHGLAAQRVPHVEDAAATASRP